MLKALGHIDGMNGRIIEGWARNAGDEMGCAIVKILIDGELIGAVSANVFRDDLERKSIRGGFAGFNYIVPAKYCDGKQHRIDCIIAECQTELIDSPVFFTRKMDSMPSNLVFQRQIFNNDFNHVEFRHAISATRKLAIISTYHNLTEFMKYQDTIIRSFHRSGYTCVVVHACDAYSHSIKMVDEMAFLVVKRNVGYDFGSYALGVNIVASCLNDLDEMVLTNDSVFHMVEDVSELIARARALKADLVGATDSFERRYHLQSYFLWAGKRLLASPILTTFLMSFPVDANRAVAVEEGELALTQHVMNEGLKVDVICSYESVAAAWMRRRDKTWSCLCRLTGKQSAETSRVLEQFENTVELIRSGVPVNATHFFWDTLLNDFNFPFLKREFVLSNPCKISTYITLPAVLEGRARVRAEIKEIVRRYGSERVLALSDHVTDQSLRHDNIQAIGSHLPSGALVGREGAHGTTLHFRFNGVQDDLLQSDCLPLEAL